MTIASYIVGGWFLLSGIASAIELFAGTTLKDVKELAVFFIGLLAVGAVWLMVIQPVLDGFMHYLQTHH